MANKNTTSQTASAPGNLSPTPTTNGDPVDLVPFITALQGSQEDLLEPLAHFLRQGLTAVGQPPTAPLPHLLVSFPAKHDYRPLVTLLHESSDALIAEAIERSFASVPVHDEAHRQSLAELKALIHRSVVQNAATVGMEGVREAAERSFHQSPQEVRQIIALAADPIRRALPTDVFAVTSELLLTALPLGIACGLNALQLFAEGRIDRLLPGHWLLQAFATLTPKEREAARDWVITALKWEAIYDVPAAPSSHNNLNS